MTLAEAIRKGAAQRPQCFGKSYRTREYEYRDASSSRVLGSCAIGAAAEGAFGGEPNPRATTDVLVSALYRAGHHVLAATASCPVRWCDDNADTPCANVLIHLNDTHRWTREQIADWVATIETTEATR